MLTRVRKRGNSQGLRCTTAALEEAQIRTGAPVKAAVQEGRIVVEPSSVVLERFGRKELVSKTPSKSPAEELGVGRLAGKEAWSTLNDAPN